MAALEISLNQNNYYEQRLSDIGRTIYRACTAALARGEDSVTVEVETRVPDGEELNAVILAITYGCPELFFLDVGDVEFTHAGERATFRFPTGKYPKKDLPEMWKQLSGEVDRIAAKIAAIPSAEEKIYRLNRYLCARVKPNIAVNASQKYLGDAYGALVKQEARCEGFAKAAKMILDRVGVESIVATGDAMDENGQWMGHAWNIIYCNGNPYQFDFTWNAGNTCFGIPAVDYMFLNDAEMEKEHRTSESYPECKDAARTYWATHCGIVNYYNQLSRVKIASCKGHYFAVAKMVKGLTAQERRFENLLQWMRTEMAAANFGKRFGARYNDKLQVLTMYFLNM